MKGGLRELFSIHRPSVEMRDLWMTTGSTRFPGVGNRPAANHETHVRGSAELNQNSIKRQSVPNLGGGQFGAPQKKKAA